MHKPVPFLHFVSDTSHYLTASGSFTNLLSNFPKLAFCVTIMVCLNKAIGNIHVKHIFA